MKTYKFYEDSGHGWLAVKRKELKELNLLNKISTYSYQKGLTVYLEEDCDANIFINAIQLTNENIITKYMDGSSPIRNYQHFCIEH